MTGNRLFVHLPPHLDAQEYRARWAAGLEPDASPYGFHHASGVGWSVRFSRRRPEPRRPWRRVIGTINDATWGIDVWHAWRNRRALRQADVVWTMLEQEGLAVAALMRAGLVPRKPLIAGTVWMVDGWEQASPRRRRVLRHLLRFWSVLTVHARPCLAIARRELPDVDSRLLRFGISDTAFPVTPPRQRRSGPLTVFAMGNDRSRDWDVLLRAFGNDDRFRVVIVCRWVDESRLAGYRNVRLVRDPDTSTIRGLYEQADYAAITMRSNHFSGITVALEAAALGVPILGSRTGGLATYFADDEMLLADVDDDAGLRDAVLRQTDDDRRAMAGRAQARFTAGRYTTRGMVERYDALTRAVREAA